MSEPKTLTPEYFEKVYAANDDPWDFASSEYEAEKYAATLAALPEENYQNAFEIGCSIGVLTEQLAARCDKLLAVDVSEKALEQASRRCANLPNVRLEIRRMPNEFPVETFDLILISEVGYYLAPEDWQTAMNEVFAHLNDGGQVALVHWTPPVDDYPQTGDAVHDSFAEFAAGKMRKRKSFRREKYRLDVWEKLMMS
ncbi:MAG: class I SAM-dependent methyltransferase [Pyrinomonadaceae bacterium]|nr:class I SAM-dependent methyltransferase [Pyrinomonadaceae bacterium]